MLSRQTSGLAERPPDQSPRNAGCPTLLVELCRHTARLRGCHVLPLPDEAGVPRRTCDRQHGCLPVTLAVVADVIGAAQFPQGRVLPVVEPAR